MIKLILIALGIVSLLGMVGIGVAFSQNGISLRQVKDIPDLSKESLYPASSSSEYVSNQPALAVRLTTFPLEASITSINEYVPDSTIIVGTFAFAQGSEDLPRLYEFNNDGTVKNAWEIERKKGTILGDRRLLQDGRLMFTIFKDGTYILNPANDTIEWHYLDKSVSHHAEMLPNGNVLTVGSYCDCVKEIDYDTKTIVWQWNANETFKPYDDEENYPGGIRFNILSPFTSYGVSTEIFPDDWTHINHAQWLEETDTFIVSLRNFDLVAEIDRAGNVVWSYGPGMIKQQHTPRVLADGTMLVFDNGNNRAIRIDRGTQKVLWEYNDLYAPVMGDVSLLADGNYKVVDSISKGGGTVKIVNEHGEVLWSLTPKFTENGRGVNIYRAHLPGLEE